MLEITDSEPLIEQNNDIEDKAIQNYISCAIMFLLVSFLLISIGFYTKINNSINKSKLIYTLVGNAGFIVVVIIIYMVIMIMSSPMKLLIVRTVSVLVGLLGTFMLLWDLVILSSKN